MCGIAGILSLDGRPIPALTGRLALMSRLIEHRGPDGEGAWEHPAGIVGLAHRRLGIIDLEGGAQPMRRAARTISYNGEVYNYLELRDELDPGSFRTRSDTEVVLAAHERWGEGAIARLRGMFAYALWDDAEHSLLLVRDRFGIKPLYYATQGGLLLFASEIKALVPFLDEIATDPDALREYLCFQLCLGERTLFRGVRRLEPGHVLEARGGEVRTRRYWEVFHRLDFEHTDHYFRRRVQELLDESVSLHLRADVPAGAYLSGGLDSSLVATLAARRSGAPLAAFTGWFAEGPEFDERRHARSVAAAAGLEHHEVCIGADDFARDLERVIYHLDEPVAGPGAFPQFAVSRLAARHRKVVLSGLGGDEIFGGYVRYLLAYFELCILAAIDGTSRSGNFIVTYESIIPNLTALAPYKPLMRQFWREGLFEPLPRRYFRLLDRSGDLAGEVRWGELDRTEDPYASFLRIFRGANVGKESSFDSMTHFDFKTLLPALLHVEDRVSMAHGLESRVPLLDHPLIELLATAPADIKFKDGELKRLLRKVGQAHLPAEVVARKDKMGFPVPLAEWLQGPSREFVQDLLGSGAARARRFVDNQAVAARIEQEPRYGRRTWGFLCLEVWQRAFHDRAAEWRRMREEATCAS